MYSLFDRREVICSAEFAVHLRTTWIGIEVNRKLVQMANP